MSNINFKQTLDNSDLINKLNQSTKAILESGTKAEGQSKKIEDAFKNQGNSLKQLLDNAKSNVVEQTNIIKQIEDDISSLSGKLKNMTPSLAQQELVKEVQSAKQALKEETAILNEKKEALDKVSKAYKEHSLQTEKTSNKLVTLITQTRNTREELAKMEQEGLRGSEAYNELQIKLGKLTNQMNDTQKQARVLADDEKYLTATIQAISGIAGAYSVAQGAIGLFGEKNEELQKIMVKVQSLMAITIGLQQVAVVLNKDSAVSILFLSKAQNTLATSLRISAIAAKAFMIAITGGLVVGLTLLMSLFEKLKVKKEANKKTTEELKEKEIDFYKSVGDTASKNLTSILMLQEKYKDIKTLEEKNKFLKKHTKAYEDLGVSVKNVKDQENLLVANADAYVRSVIAKAKADAYRAEITKKQSELIQLENKDVEHELKKKVGRTDEIIYGRDGIVGRGAEIVRDDKKTEKLKQEALEKRKKEREKLEKDIINMAKNALKTEQEIESILSNADIKQFEKPDNSQAKKYVDEKINYWESINSEIEKSKINLIENEFERTLALNEFNMRKELDALDKHIEDIKKKKIEKEKAKFLSEGGKIENFKTPIIKLDEEEQKIYEERQKQIIENNYKLNEEAYNKLLIGFETYQQKREKILKQYNDKIKELERQGLTENISEVKEVRDEELNKLDSEFAKKQEEYLLFVERVKNASLDVLQKELAYVMTELQTLSLTDEQKAVLEQMVVELKENIEKLSKDKKPRENNTIKDLNELRQSIDHVINSFDGLDEKTKKSLENASRVAGGIITIIQGLENLNKVGEEALSAVEKASVILTIVSAAIQIFGVLNDMIGANEEKRVDRLIKQLEYQSAINESLRETNKLLAEANNIYFGQDKFQAMQNYVKLLEEARKKFISLLLNSWTELYNIPLYDSDGKFDINLATAGLNSNELTEVGKKKLQALIDAYEYIIDLENSLNSLKAEITGQFRDDLMDSLYEGWMKGADGALQYGEIAGKVLDDLLRKMIYTKFFAGIFDDLSKVIDEINTNTELSEEERISAWGEALQNFGDTYRDASQEAGQFWQTWVSTLQGMGLDIMGETNRNAQSQGIQSISQESADRIDGALTALLGSSYRIEGHTETIKDYIVMMLSEIQAIRVNTAKLDGIDYKINQILTNGIKVV
ncbi:MAG: hypothetical protein ACK5MH_09075 [Bacteroidales bacterium]